MSPARILGIIVAVAGIVLLIMGMNATEAVGEKVRESVTGHYSDRTTWFIVGGIVAIVGGALTAMLGDRFNSKT
jgi:hypothetical protein